MTEVVRLDEDLQASPPEIALAIMGQITASLRLPPEKRP